MEFFIDTNVWIASRFEAGDAADWARRFLDREEGLVTSQYIVDEVVAFCLGARELKHRPTAERLAMARAFLEIFQGSGKVDVLPVSELQFGEAKSRFEESRLGLTITDWTNLVLTRDRNITGLCTFDRALREAARAGPWRIRALPEDSER
jgi:predicted nucleic acid-binding protein